MGIKFLCPNGHKLNVKSYMGGMRARCPKCDARVVVPSIGEGSDSETEDLPTLSEESPGTESIELSTSVVKQLPVAATASADVLDDAPDAVWYVRPPAGGQFGPASGEVMRSWLAEGRVTASALVWRGGWPEWRPAASVFQQLGKGIGVGTAEPAADANVAAKSNAANSSAASSASIPVRAAVTAPAAVAGVDPLAELSEEQAQRIRQKRQQDNRKLILISTILAVAILILAITCIVVLVQRGSDSDKSDSQADRPTSAKSVSPIKD